MLDVLLHGTAHFIVLFMKISLADFILVGFFEHVDSVQPLDAFLQLFVIIKMVVEYFIHLVFELLLEVFLLSNLRDCLSFFLLHSFSLKFHVFNDQSKILIDNEEMLGFIVHLGFLFLQPLDNLHARPNS